jgi:peptidoglycan/LPS O-acetylase OafA/YrhL
MARMRWELRSALQPSNGHFDSILDARMQTYPDRSNIFPSRGAFTFGYFPQLDGLRGLAILLVIADHVMVNNFRMAVNNNLGGLGVLLFFVLSGFLITGLLDREKLSTGHISFSRFYVRRVLRLFPAFICFLAVVCLLVGFKQVKDTPWYAVVACLIYVRNIWGRGAATSHIWSLSIEEQFYTCWPWIMRSRGRIGGLQIAIAGTIVISIFRMVAIHLNWFAYNTGVFYERSWFRFDSILIGCAAALVFCQPETMRYPRRYLSGAMLPVLLWPSIISWTIWGEGISRVWYLTIQMVLAVLILMNLILSKESFYLSMLSNSVARWFGQVSYSWYLWQQLFTVVTPPAWLGLRTFPLNVLTSLLLALASRKLIEQPFLRMKDRFDTKKVALPQSV